MRGLLAKKKAVLADASEERDRIDGNRVASMAKAELKRQEKQEAKELWMQKNEGKFHCTCRIEPATSCQDNRHLCCVCGVVKGKVCKVNPSRGIVPNRHTPKKNDSLSTELRAMGWAGRESL
jgi:hypothetical protein